MQELALLMMTECADVQEPEFALLVRQARAGDATAFEAILCQFERCVLLTAMRLLNGNLEDAKHAAQQGALVRIYYLDLRLNLALKEGTNWDAHIRASIDVHEGQKVLVGKANTDYADNVSFWC